MKSHRLVSLLVTAGHDVLTTADLQLDATADKAVLSAAYGSSRVLLTFNCPDFRALHEAGMPHAGIFLVYRHDSSNPEMPLQDIVGAIGNVVASGLKIAGEIFNLNQWKY